MKPSQQTESISISFSAVSVMVLQFHSILYYTDKYTNIYVKDEP